MAWQCLWFLNRTDVVLVFGYFSGFIDHMDLCKCWLHKQSGGGAQLWKCRRSYTCFSNRWSKLLLQIKPIWLVQDRIKKSGRKGTFLSSNFLRETLRVKFQIEDFNFSVGTGNYLQKVVYCHLLESICTLLLYLAWWHFQVMMLPETYWKILFCSLIE